MSKERKIEFTKEFSSPVLGNVYLGRVLTVGKDLKEKQADHFVSMGYAVEVGKGKEKDPEKEAGDETAADDKKDAGEETKTEPAKKSIMTKILDSTSSKAKKPEKKEETKNANRRHARGSEKAT